MSSHLLKFSDFNQFDPHIDSGFQSILFLTPPKLEEPCPSPLNKLVDDESQGMVEED